MDGEAGGEVAADLSQGKGPVSEQLTEMDHFKALCLSVLNASKPIAIRCGSEREAKTLRRRLYRLRDATDPFVKPLALQVVFQVVGFRVLCERERKRAKPDSSWPERITYGES